MPVPAVPDNEEVFPMTAEFGRVRFEDIDNRLFQPKAKQIGGEVLRDDPKWVVVFHDSGRTEIPTQNVICIDYPTTPKEQTSDDND